MQPGTRSDRSAELARRLREASALLLATVESIDRHQWRLVPEPGVWSISKEVEHAAEAAAYHQWIVRLTIGDDVPKRKPVLERAEMTSDLSTAEAVELIRQRAEGGARLLEALTDEQLELPTRPPRARAPVLAETIENMLIGHIDSHRAEIEAKLRAFG
jgi:uncharacterized damage-inducible protein DinB